jgi:hypothetical protein
MNCCWFMKYKVNSWIVVGSWNIMWIHELLLVHEISCEFMNCCWFMKYKVNSWIVVGSWNIIWIHELLLVHEISCDFMNCCWFMKYNVNSWIVVGYQIFTGFSLASSNNEIHCHIVQNYCREYSLQYLNNKFKWQEISDFLSIYKNWHQQKPKAP